MTKTDTSNARPALGFWGCWSLSVGTMIGSGVFLLPTVLAPYGLLSFGGWAMTAGGSILLALILGRLAGRITRTGGTYAYAQSSFGDLPGFLTAWGYWASIYTAGPAIAIAFVGYLTVFFPELSGSPLWQGLIALALMWTLTLVSIRGAGSAGTLQLLTTILKLIPLVIIIGLGVMFGDTANLPAINPTGGSLLGVLSATALLTMWAFAGLDVGVIPAGDVKDPARTLPRAVIWGTVTVAVVYIGSTAAVMMLVPAGELVQSTAPFADAAARLGQWGGPLVAAGALVATAGSLNGNTFAGGQLPMAVALDRLAPSILARRTATGAPWFALILTTGIGSILLGLNYSRGLVGAFTFLLMMSTLCTLLPLLISAIAELKHSWRQARPWAVIAIIGSLYALFAIFGSGLEVIGWGLVLLMAGIPVYYLGRPKHLDAGAEPVAEN
jgi:APA family basic amino acid/polyamine antiporter